MLIENLNETKEAPSTERLLDYFNKKSKETENLISKMRKNKPTPLVPKFIKDSPREKGLEL